MPAHRTKKVLQELGNRMASPHGCCTLLHQVSHCSTYGVNTEDFQRTWDRALGKPPQHPEAVSACIHRVFPHGGDAQHPKTTDMKGTAVLLDSRETKAINKIKNTAFLAELPH